MKIYLLIMFLGVSTSLFAKEEMTNILEGTVSYISSQNIYVKFSSTEGIETGDTLFLKINNNYIPAIKVDYISSTSCAGVSVTDDKIEVITNNSQGQLAIAADHKRYVLGRGLAEKIMVEQDKR